MEDVLVPIIVIPTIFIGLPWLIFHYVTQWKRSGSLSMQDENLLDELHDLARRLDDRLGTIERIIAADDPGFARLAQDRKDKQIAPPSPADEVREWRRQR